MKIVFTKTDANSKTKIREKLEKFVREFKDTSTYYNENEIFSVVLSAIRANEFNIVEIQQIATRIQYVVDGNQGIHMRIF